MMEISQVQYERIADCFPVHRGNVAYDNLRVLNAILYVMKWVQMEEAPEGLETGIQSTCA